MDSRQPSPEKKKKEKPITLKRKMARAVYIASGSIYPELAEEVAESLGTRTRGMDRKMYSNGEVYVRLEESVRGKHFIAIQALAGANGYSVNDALVELGLMADAAKRASASGLTAVAPYLAYSRQERKARGREPISAAWAVEGLQKAGYGRLVSVDLHAPAVQGTFAGPFDHLTAYPLISEALKVIVGENPDDYVIVSPDEGRTKESGLFAARLGVDIVHMTKTRIREDSGTIVRPKHIADVDGRTAIMVDDILDTSRTLATASETLRNSGARGVIVAATHGLFSDPALDILQNAPIDKIIVTDTVPQAGPKEALGDRLHVLPSSPMIARALYEIITKGSVSGIFNDKNYR